MKKISLFLIQAIIALSLVCAGGCSKKDDKGNDIPKGGLQVGQSYQGGIIAYVDDTGKHGLIAAPEDQSPGILWWNGSFIVTGATGTMIGTGKENTAKIVQAQGQGNYAAKLCADLVLDGYSDWFLPSFNELDVLYRNRDAIGMFSSGVYWSSSELNSNYAWYQTFSGGGQGSNGKENTGRVRAVRAF